MKELQNLKLDVVSPTIFDVKRKMLQEKCFYISTRDFSSYLFCKVDEDLDAPEVVLLESDGEYVIYTTTKARKRRRFRKKEKAKEYFMKMRNALPTIEEFLSSLKPYKRVEIKYQTQDTSLILVITHQYKKGGL